MPFSVIFSIFTAVLQVVATVFLALFIPSFLIRLVKKDLPFWTAFVSAVILLLLPALAILPNLQTNDFLQYSFSPWGVPGLTTYWIASWSFTAGAVLSALFSGGTLVFSRLKSAPACAIFFLFLSLILDLFAQCGVAFLVFGAYGKQVGADNIVYMAVYCVIVFMASLAIGLSESRRTLYSRSERLSPE